MKAKLTLIAFVTAMMACSSTPPVAELPATADPTQEITRVENGINASVANQVDVLSPENFESAADTLDKAKEARNRNKNQKDVLYKIALAQAYLDKANGNAAVAEQLLPNVVKGRKDAIAANAHKYFPEEFSKADLDLKNLTRNFDRGDTSGADRMKDTLEGKYTHMELQAIRKANIGPAIDNLEQAKKEGARKLVPQTLDWAEQKIGADDGIISANPHDTEAVSKAAADALAASNRLLSMLRQAKAASAQTPEEIASHLERKEVAIGTAQTELTAQEKAAADLESQNKELEKTDKLEKQFEMARQQFTPDEAEVYKQGDRILLRLKGLSFPKDQAVITSDNFPLLTKVQAVIKETGPMAIVVEGHTDSTGSKEVNVKLSEERAEAVESYLKANNPSDKATYTVTGFGDARPIASNKTRAGRAQNRRVDIILNAQPDTGRASENLHMENVPVEEQPKNF